MNPRCETCRHFERSTEADGNCRRMPPTVFPAHGDLVLKLWPPVDVADWCGEYAERERP